MCNFIMKPNVNANVNTTAVLVIDFNIGTRLIVNAGVKDFAQEILYHIQASVVSAWKRNLVQENNNGIGKHVLVNVKGRNRVK